MKTPKDPSNLDKAYSYLVAFLKDSLERIPEESHRVPVTQQVQVCLNVIEEALVAHKKTLTEDTNDEQDSSGQS